MPELPEIETMRRAVRPRALERTIVSAEVRHPSVIARPDPESFIRLTEGRRIDGLDRRGKYIIARLDDGSRIVMHMRMTGCIVAAPAGHPEMPHTHIVLHLDDGTELRFSDSRRFGRFWLFADGEEDAESGVSSLGPEPDDPALTPGYLRGRIGGSGRPIKTCLLDQSMVAGIGNIYSDEILFSCGIDPACPAKSLDDDDWVRLADEIPECIGRFTEMRVSPAAQEPCCSKWAVQESGCTKKRTRGRPYRKRAAGGDGRVAAEKGLPPRCRRRAGRCAGYGRYVSLGLQSRMRIK